MKNVNVISQNKARRTAMVTVTENIGGENITSTRHLRFDRKTLKYRDIQGNLYNVA